MKRNYKNIVCFLRDSGRCKYASWKPFDRTCFCEKIDECAQREKEMLDKVLKEIRCDPRSPWPTTYSRMMYRDNQYDQYDQSNQYDQYNDKQPQNNQEKEHKLEQELTTFKKSSLCQQND